MQEIPEKAQNTILLNGKENIIINEFGAMAAVYKNQKSITLKIDQEHFKSFREFFLQNTPLVPLSPKE